MLICFYIESCNRRISKVDDAPEALSFKGSVSQICLFEGAVISKVDPALICFQVEPPSKLTYKVLELVL